LRTTRGTQYDPSHTELYTSLIFALSETFGLQYGPRVADVWRQKPGLLVIFPSVNVRERPKPSSRSRYHMSRAPRYLVWNLGQFPGLVTSDGTVGPLSSATPMSVTYCACRALNAVIITILVNLVGVIVDRHVQCSSIGFNWCLQGRGLESSKAYSRACPFLKW
jgi:hypothetical protein